MPILPAILRRLAVFVAAALAVVPGRFDCGAAAQAQDRAVSEAVQRGVNFIKSGGSQGQQTSGFALSGGQRSLAGLALLKAGEPIDGPEISAAIAGTLKKVESGVYEPAVRRDHIYEAGVDAMLLADSDPERYWEPLEVITEYIITQQGADGSWDYPGEMRTVGDTSITQYALLGLWAATRVGMEVPLSVWDKAARWHLRTQSQDGGFAYQPGRSVGAGGGTSTDNMTAGGVANLMISRLHLYPDSKPIAAQSDGAADGRGSARRGLLEKVDLTTPQGARPARPQNYKVETSLSALDASAERGLDWMTARFRPVGTLQYKMYYYYAMERLVALADVTERGGRNWYLECQQAVLESQESDGSWKTQNGPIVGTCFAVLFLTRSTAKLLDRPPPGPGLGGGLLTGGRGLPRDLSHVEVKNGRVEAVKTVGPIEELLAALENPQTIEIESVQTALVESVQLGDREALIGEQERLLKLARDPRDEVRRTALWALARGSDIRVAPVLIGALEDRNVDVMVEAHNALCYLSRRPRAFGLPDSPVAELADGAPDSEVRQAIATWQAAAVNRWHEWYLGVRPYEERDVLSPWEDKGR